MNKKIKILTLSDHPLSPSVGGTQTRYIIEGMLKTGRYQFVCLGGAMKHHDYTPQKVDPWGEDWIIYPQPTNPGKRLILHPKLDPRSVNFY